ncbi:MAG TPA: cytochrome P450 [Trichocoleus sp.]
MSSIPTPTTPRFIQLINWILRPLAVMDTHSRQLGDLFRMRLGQFDLVTASKPDTLRYMLTHDSEELSAPGEVNQILKPLLGENSVILLDGESHRRRRQLIMPPFHGERLRAYADLIQTLARRAVSDLAPGETFVARDVMQQITMRVILQAVFGLHEGDRYHRLEILLRDRINLASSPLTSSLIFFPVLQTDLGSWSPGAKIKALAAEIDGLIYAEIRDRRANPDPNRTDILSLLLLAQDETGKGMTDPELRDELMTLLVAGHETTATALTWALYWAHHLPEVQKNLLEEIQTSGADGNALALTKLPYLSAVCNETLRIYPVAMLTFARRVEQPIELEGYVLEPGTVVTGSIYLLHRRPELYPDPELFKPERFLERQYSAFEFMPFGAGERRCVGAALAQYELKIVLGTLLSEFEFALADTQPATPERRGVTLGVKGGVKLIFKGKRQQLVPA